MDSTRFGYIYDNSDAVSQTQSWSTDDASGRSSVQDLTEEINNNLENRICQYLSDLCIETFTSPTLKEDNYNHFLKQRIFKSFDAFVPNKENSILLKKRKQHIKLGE
ncbi:unnamed protein product (macronuclear) [Paramecium tetraurelia]|uniref:RGS domain-containing protein n=1 Tax=Paramecium tetraurelia TaxID=5888 RepID=A0BE50_PARTE|nr:uncharacterized protein GSPATT00027849001 [Paramecium tetraurelia]CAK56817.1 unnamed protein product [Paramecium tetraurelia]|eukprot:XP_001424215.1 hypothetical protein (macronuclear) [Paramecium tetraurelia strain d4-2]